MRRSPKQLCLGGVLLCMSICIGTQRIRGAQKTLCAVEAATIPAFVGARYKEAKKTAITAFRTFHAFTCTICWTCRKRTENQRCKSHRCIIAHQPQSMNRRHHQRFLCRNTYMKYPIIQETLYNSADSGVEFTGGPELYATIMAKIKRIRICDSFLLQFLYIINYCYYITMTYPYSSIVPPL